MLSQHFRLKTNANNNVGVAWIDCAQFLPFDFVKQWESGKNAFVCIKNGWINQTLAIWIYGIIQIYIRQLHNIKCNHPIRDILAYLLIWWNQNT